MTEIYIINLGSNNSEYERFKLQTVPDSVEVGGKSDLKSIATLGRNNPFYHYTGSEDTLRFDISWYPNPRSGQTDTEAKKDVVRNCKALRSLTKADGYNKSIPTLAIVFGELFKNSRWVMERADYTLGTFSRGQGLLPAYAKQTLRFKRVTSQNLTWQQFRKL